MNFNAYGKAIDNIFALMGADENDITKAIAFCLASCQAFMDEFLRGVFGSGFQYSFHDSCVFFQEHHGDGITDIEIRQPGLFHVIIEAKKYFNLPDKAQLDKYASVINESHAPSKRIIVLSNADREAAKNDWQIHYLVLESK